MTVPITSTYRVERLDADTPRVRDAASIQLAAFDYFTEYQGVIEPHPRPSWEKRLDKLEFRINEKLRPKPEVGQESSHLGYVAVDEKTGETLGMAYWMKPGRTHKLPIGGKMMEQQKEAWEGWDKEKYSTLYAAFQEKMSGVLQERGEKECWYLEVLAIHPDHQGKRLGPNLLDHHLNQVDNSTLQNAPAYLELSPPGRGLYKSRGYEDVGDVHAEGWEDAFPAMYRPRMRKDEA